MPTTYVRRMRNTNLEIRIAGSSCRPQKINPSVFLSCRHTDEMIHKLESAGLGYHVATQETQDRLGKT